ncbi:hypothetical protein I317_03484 [Kwoniella heveanensis CBS 569]|nr:hypothetical protein I317_03484 [Kwoniella heveanensis CBS 569]
MYPVSLLPPDTDGEPTPTHVAAGYHPDSQTISPTLLRPVNSFHTDAGSSSSNPNILLADSVNLDMPIDCSTHICNYDSSQQVILLPADHPFSHGGQVEPLRPWLTGDFQPFPFLTAPFAPDPLLSTEPTLFSSPHLDQSGFQGAGNFVGHPTSDSRPDIGRLSEMPSSSSPSSREVHDTRAVHQYTPTGLPILSNPIPSSPSTQSHAQYRISTSVQLDNISRRLVYHPLTFHHPVPAVGGTTPYSVAKVCNSDLPPAAFGPLAPAIELKAQPLGLRTASSNHRSGVNVLRFGHASVVENETDNDDKRMDIRELEPSDSEVDRVGDEDDGDSIDVELNGTGTGAGAGATQFLPTPPPSARIRLRSNQRHPEPVHPIATAFGLGAPCTSSPEEVQGGREQHSMYEGESELSATMPSSPNVLLPQLERSPSPITRNGRYPARIGKLAIPTSTSTAASFWSSKQSASAKASASTPAGTRLRHLGGASMAGGSTASPNAIDSASANKGKTKKTLASNKEGKKKRSSSVRPLSIDKNFHTHPLKISRWGSAAARTSRSGDNKTMPTGPFLWAALHMLTLPRYSQWVEWHEESRTAYILDTHEFAENVYSQYCTSNQWTSFQRNMTNYKDWGYIRFAVEGTRQRQQRIDVPSVDDLCVKWVRMGNDSRVSNTARDEYLIARMEDEALSARAVALPESVDKGGGVSPAPAKNRSIKRRSRSSKQVAAPKIVIPKAKDLGIAGAGMEVREAQGGSLHDGLPEESQITSPNHVDHRNSPCEHIDQTLVHNATGPTSAAQHQQSHRTFAALMSPESQHGGDKLIYSPNLFTPSPTFYHPSLPLSSSRGDDEVESEAEAQFQAAYPTPHTSTSSSSWRLHE